MRSRSRTSRTGTRTRSTSKTFPPRVRGINIGIPEDLDELVWDLLGKTPADRPAGIGEALAVLRDTSPRPATPAPTPSCIPIPRPVTGCAGTDRRGRRLRARSSRAWPEPPRFLAGAGRVRRPDRPRQGRTRLHRTSLPSALQLASELALAVSAWGPREPAVVDAQLVCADAARPRR
ncbi:hypothetical protein ACRAWF_38285 [Streptomyces sp. L7]